jgi:uncharacterized C2H2 Zn-finger protein
MKFPFGGSKKEAEQESIFKCKECPMSFQSKQSLDMHKQKAKHFGGRIYFGKQDK